MYQLKYSKDFENNLKILLQNKKSLGKTIFLLKEYLKIYGVTEKIYKYYDIKRINDKYYRIKFIPYRVIIKFNNNTIYLENIFKRKGKSDYKKYN